MEIAGPKTERDGQAVLPSENACQPGQELLDPLSRREKCKHRDIVPLAGAAQEPGQCPGGTFRRAGADIPRAAGDEREVSRAERRAAEQHAETHLIAIGKGEFDRPRTVPELEQGRDDVAVLHAAA